MFSIVPLNNKVYLVAQQIRDFLNLTTTGIIAYAQIPEISTVSGDIQWSGNFLQNRKLPEIPWNTPFVFYLRK